MIIIADPTSEDDTSQDFALKIVADNVVVRNVIVYHAANGMGIYVYQVNTLTIENVQVIAYGNAKGAQACPTRSPFSGYDCSNIKIIDATSLTMNNVYVENGSRGASIKNSPNADVQNFVAKNVRGP